MHESTEDGAEGEEERTSQGDSMLSTEPDTGLDLITLRSRPDAKPSQTLKVCHLSTAPKKLLYQTCEITPLAYINKTVLL